MTKRGPQVFCGEAMSPVARSARSSNAHRIAKMRCFNLLGERVKARDFDRQVAEFQIRAAILNRFTAL